MIKTNYHTHSDFCDGSESPEKIIKKALEKGFDILGFSSHSMYPFASNWHIPPKSFPDYVSCINELKQKYNDKIKILLGFEADYIPYITKPDFDVYKRHNPDYLIGSVHYIFKKDARLAVDYASDLLKERINTLYNGNSKQMVIEYFELEREMLKESNFTIIGHADLVRKNNKKLDMFNEEDSWYKEQVRLTADEIKRAGVIAEVNTGAITRGYMDDVYPSAYFLSLLHERGVPVLLSSDSHESDSLDAHFDKALNAVLNAGYKELAYIDSDKKIKFQKIQGE